MRHTLPWPPALRGRTLVSAVASKKSPAGLRLALALAAGIGWRQIGGRQPSPRAAAWARLGARYLGRGWGRRAGDALAAARARNCPRLQGRDVRLCLGLA